jgi:hypothetical protein
MIANGYQPGLLHELQQQLGDVQSELETEREKVEKGAKRAEHIRRAQEAGRIDAFAAARALDAAGGDEDRVSLLERRAGGLRQQIADAQAAIAPQERQAPGPVEAAAARAQQIAAAVAEEFRLKDEADARAREQLKRDRARFYAERRGVSSRSQPAVVLEARTTRTGGPGFGPMNIPWARVTEWLSKGWRP